MYRQCTLQRGTTQQVAWIPETFAKVGSYVNITENGKSEDGWKVLSVSDIRQTEDYRRSHERDHMYQRQASDI
jgi:hypothetical protein